MSAWVARMMAAGVEIVSGEERTVPRTPTSLAAMGLLVVFLALAATGGTGTVPMRAQTISPQGAASPAPGGSPQPPSSTATATPATLPSVTGSGSVLHFKVRKVDRNPLGFVIDRSFSEYWIDDATGDVRRTDFDHEGSLQQLHVQRGLTYGLVDFARENVKIHTAARPDGPSRRRIVGPSIAYRDDVRAGRTPPSSESRRDGRRVLTVRSTIDRPALELRGIDASEVHIDAETGLVLEQVFYRRVAGASVTVRRTSFEYEVIEHLDRSPSAIDLFTMPSQAYPNWDRETVGNYTPSTIASFKAYDVFWLGDRFDSIPFASINHKEFVRGQGRTIPQYDRSTRVDVIYYASPTQDRGMRQVSLLSEPLPGLEREAAQQRALQIGMAQAGEQITVAGRLATLHADPASAEARLVLDIGATRVTIYAESRDQAIRAGEALQRLN